MSAETGVHDVSFRLFNSEGFQFEPAILCLRTIHVHVDDPVPIAASASGLATKLECQRRGVVHSQKLNPWIYCFF